MGNENNDKLEKQLSIVCKVLDPHDAWDVDTEVKLQIEWDRSAM